MQMLDKTLPVETDKEDLQARELEDLRQRCNQYEAWFSAFDKHASFEYWFKDTDSRYLLVNKEFEKAIQRTRQDLIGKTPADLFEPDRAERLRDVDLRVLSQDRPLKRIIPCDASGKMMTLEEIRFPVLDKNDERIGLGCLAREVGIGNQVQEALERAQSVSKIGNWRWSLADSYLISCSDEFARLYGIGREAIFKFAETRYHKTLHVDDYQQVIDIINQAISTGQRYEVEYRVCLHDGIDRVFLEIGEVVCDTEGKAVEYAGIIQDVSERKKVELALHDAKAMAERDARRAASLALEANQANEAKSNFLAAMTHDLRTPLNAIIGFSDMLLLDKEQQTDITGEYAQYISDSGHLLLEMINQLLDLSKIESGKLEMNFTPLNVRQVVEQACSYVDKALDDKAPTLSINPPETGIPFMGDAQAFLRILVNLLSNAMKFTDKSGQVSISWSIAVSGGLTISVSDTGIGMTEEDARRVLEPFAQVSNVGLSSIGGTGLGLPITQQLVCLHGGQLEVMSELGKGTEITLLFPEERTLDR